METRRTFCRRAGLLLAGRSFLPSLPKREGDGAALDTVNLTVEKSHVLFEMHAFERCYLPALLARPGQTAPSTEALDRWGSAVRQLQQAVLGRGQCRPTLDPEAIRRLCVDTAPGCAAVLNRAPSACLSRVAGRICWHFYPYSGQGVAEREEQVRHVMRWAGVGDERVDAPWLELRQVLPAVQELFLALPLASAKRMGGYISVLPILAELDPAFAMEALDRSRLVAAVEGNPALAASERARQRTVLDSRFYARCLCHGLALTLEALANNHFPKIGRFLALPDLHADAFWSGLIPKILFTTLYRKTAVLRHLVQKNPRGRDSI